MAKIEFSESVKAFSEAFESSPEMQKEYAELEANYPGSIEIRENVVNDVLIPWAKSKGYEFTLNDLKRFEMLRYMRLHQDVEADLNEPDDDSHYWLINHGWTNDEEIFEK